MFGLEVVIVPVEVARSVDGKIPALAHGPLETFGAKIIFGMRHPPITTFSLVIHNSTMSF
jgi:hypothetical protein